jgi:hypothetical protein
VVCGRKPKGKGDENSVGFVILENLQRFRVVVCPVRCLRRSTSTLARKNLRDLFGIFQDPII